MKRMLSLLLAAVLLIALCGVTAFADDASELVGSYVLTGIAGEGFDITPEILELFQKLGLSITLTVNEDGSAVMELLDETEQMRFNFAERTVIIDGELYSYAYQDGSIFIDFGDGGLTFSKEGEEEKYAGPFDFYVLQDLLDEDGVSILDEYAPYFPVEGDPASVTLTIFESGYARAVDSAGVYSYFFDFDRMTCWEEGWEDSPDSFSLEGDLLVMREGGEQMVFRLSDPGYPGPYQMVIGEDESEETAGLLKLMAPFCTMEISGDGNAVMSILGESKNLSFDFGSMTVTIDGGTTDFTYQNGKLSFKIGEETMRFARVLPAGEDAPAAAPQTPAPAAPAQETAGTWDGIDFETTDLDGNRVTARELFSSNIVTMVNVWASWCPPCVREIPELQEMNTEFITRGCEIVGLLIDGDDPAGLEDAKAILEQAGVTYRILMPWDGMYDVFPVSAVPTSFFVDRNGHIVGDPIEGAYVDEYLPTLEQAIRDTAG